MVLLPLRFTTIFIVSIAIVRFHTCLPFVSNLGCGLFYNILSVEEGTFRDPFLNLISELLLQNNIFKTRQTFIFVLTIRFLKYLKESGSY